MAGIKKIICKIKGHDYSFNFGWAPTRCVCKRCNAKWKTIPNPEYIRGKSNPLEVDIFIWVKDLETNTNTEQNDKKK
jgi:hypothetical protein